MIKPSPLKIGDTLGVIAPAGVVDAAQLEAGLSRLKEMGFRTQVGDSVRRVFRTMAGEDGERARDLVRMFSDPEVKAVLCARGGYGSARLIPFLDADLIRRHPKIFVGCSDITALLLFLTQVCGLVAFHGPMAAPHFGRRDDPLTRNHFLEMLTSPSKGAELSLSGVRVLRPGKAEGRLTGGCLSLLCSAVGTPVDPRTEGAILFLEDVGEASYRIDRMLTHLKQAGKLAGVRGLLFGQMPGCHPPEGSGGGLAEVILDVLGDFSGPVLLGVPSGHGDHCLTLPLGVRAEVSAPAHPGPEAALKFEEPALDGGLSRG